MNKPIPKIFRKRLVRMIRELNQMIRDIEWWNKNRTDAEPIDLGWELVMLDKASKALKALDKGDLDRHTRFSSELAETAQQVYAAQRDD